MKSKHSDILGAISTCDNHEQIVSMLSSYLEMVDEERDDTIASINCNVRILHGERNEYAATCKFLAEKLNSQETRYGEVLEQQNTHIGRILIIKLLTQRCLSITTKKYAIMAKHHNALLHHHGIEEPDILEELI